jgi:hypothetical protein
VCLHIIDSFFQKVPFGDFSTNPKKEDLNGLFTSSLLGYYNYISYTIQYMNEKTNSTLGHLDTHIELYLNDVFDYGGENELILAQSALLVLKNLPPTQKEVIEDFIVYVNNM